MNADTQQIVNEFAQELLKQMGIAADIKVTHADNTYQVAIDTDDTGVLIGYHGHTLNALQTMLGHMVFKKLGNWERIIVDVGDYRQKRAVQLEDMAAEFADRIAKGEESIVVSNLTPYERRIIHMALADHPEVMSASEGEGKERRLVIKRKNSKS